MLGSQLWLSEHSSSPRERDQWMFQKEKPIRGCMVSSTLSFPLTLLSHDPLTPLHWLESNISPSSVPLMCGCHCRSEVQILLPILCGPPPRPPMVIPDAPDWQFASLCWDCTVCCWQQHTHRSLSITNHPVKFTHNEEFFFFPTRLDGQCIPKSHCVFWKHVSTPSRTETAMCLRCRDYMYKNSTLMVIDIDK